MKTTARSKHRMFIMLLLSQVVCGAVFSAPLLIAVEDDAPPWSRRDGTGFANDLVRASFEAVGVEVNLSVVPYARGKDMAIKGKAVACFSMSWTPDLDRKIVFADKPLFLCYADYFTSGTSRVKAEQESDLSTGTVVGIVRGYEYPPSTESLKKKGVLVFEVSESEELNLKKLSRGRIDAALVNCNEMKPAELLLARAGGGADKVRFPRRHSPLIHRLQQETSAGNEGPGKLQPGISGHI